MNKNNLKKINNQQLHPGNKEPKMLNNNCNNNNKIISNKINNNSLLGSKERNKPNNKYNQKKMIIIKTIQLGNKEPKTLNNR